MILIFRVYVPARKISQRAAANATRIVNQRTGDQPQRMCEPTATQTPPSPVGSYATQSKDHASQLLGSRYEEAYKEYLNEEEDEEEMDE